MKVFIAGVSQENQNINAYDSWVRLKTKKGDAKGKIVGQRGDQARVQLLDAFLQGPWDAIFLCDLDMIFPNDALERLRAHDVSMVSGHYWKRGFPMQSIAGIGSWPFTPINLTSSLMDYKENLVSVDNSGFGCALIKREVINIVKQDMHPNDSPFAIGTCPEIIDDGSAFGSDVRFFAKAKAAGFPLYLDMGVECRHAATIFLDSKVYEKLRDKEWEELERARIEEKRAIIGTKEI